MKSKTSLLCLSSLLTISTLITAKADVIADWTFQTAASTNSIIGAGLTPSGTQSGVLADIGVGTASAKHATVATAWSIPTGNGSSSCWSANNWSVGDYFQFQVSTISFTGIGVSFDQTGSATGPSQFALQYSTDGTTFSPFASPYALLVNAAPNTPWSAVTVNPAYSYSFDLSAVTSLNNAASVYFRLVDNNTTSLNGGTVAAGGTDRVDNFIVSGTSTVPEPTSFAIVGLGLLGLRLMRRKY